jgi:TatD DNase family protein
MIDSHAHYDNERFDLDRDAAIRKAFESGVTHIVNPGCDIGSSLAAIALAEAYPGMFAAVGFHPHDASKYAEGDMERLKALCAHAKVVAIGEIGLDYHYDFSPRPVQQEVLRRHIELARSVRKPVILHDRESHRDVMDIVRSEKAWEVGGVFHCWSGSREMADEALEMGFHIGIGGSVTFRNASRLLDMAAHIPDDRLLVETDCPYMAPEPFRGQRNWSGLMVHILERLAAIRGTTFEKLERITTDNAVRLFGLPN